MQSNWTSHVLTDITEIIGGGTPRRSVDNYWNGNISWLSVVDFNTGNKYVSNTKESITELGLQKSSTKILDRGQLIISARGTVGALAQLKKPMAFNQSCYGLNVKQKYSYNNFLYYLVKYKISNLQQITHGAVFDTITKDTFNQIDVNLPPFSTQQKIAHILSTLDDKIELNRKMNKTLEEMAQSLFKSWFVDFDPVNAKAKAKDSDTGPEQIAKELGISKEALDLFPDEFEESEMGLIPNGWKVKTLGEIAENFRYPVNPSTLSPNTPYVGLEHIEKKCFSLSNWGESSGVSSQKSTFEAGNFLFGKLRTYFHKVCISPVMGICSTDILVIKAKNDDLRGIVGCFIFQSEFIEFASRRSTGTRMPRTNWKDMATYTIALPDNNLIHKFNNIALSCWEKGASNVNESQNLIKLRDNLLPKLLSGELDVSELNLEIQ